MAAVGDLWHMRRPRSGKAQALGHRLQGVLDRRRALSCRSWRPPYRKVRLGRGQERGRPDGAGARVHAD
eukprot:7383130-Prymnesium_polylepis.1